MREAANAAWDRDWQRAISEYQRAVEAVPDDSQALAGLALSLMEAGYSDRALAAYEQVSKLVPSDPLPYEKIAQILEAVGRDQDAAKKYTAVAEIYFARKDLTRAIPYWQKAAELEPDLPQPHMRLAVVFERDPKTHGAAVYEYVDLARLLQQHGQGPKAEQALERARRLDPLNADVRNALDDLKRGNVLQRPQHRVAPEIKLPQTGGLNADPFEDQEERPPERTPLEEAGRNAMSFMADLIFSGEVPSAAQAHLMNAINSHQLGEVEPAIQAYVKAIEAGLNHPGLHLALGLLYQKARRNRDAIPHLSRVVGVPDYAFHGNLALGMAYLAETDFLRSAQYLVTTLQMADREVNPQYDEAGYMRLVGGLDAQGRDYLMEISKSLVAVLNDRNWREKLGSSFAGYAAQGNTNYVPDLIELMIEGGRPEIAQAMERAGTYLNRNMLRMAMEEIYFALQRSPDYLPAHVAVAELLAKEGRTQEAAYKLNLVANTYLLRGNAEKAADLYAEVLDLWPADVAARERVIDMLKSQGRGNEALHHYQELGDLYYRLRADPDQAVRIYREALSYAQRQEADAAPRLTLLKSLADIESQRLNWRDALNAYEHIIELAPDDHEAVMSLIDLHFRVAQPDRAIRTLDNYMRYCLAHGETGRIVVTLEEQVRRHPDEIALRHRLADVYQQQKRLSDAIQQMDALGELYLDAGRKSDAVDTIRRIIAMNPPDMEGYRQLLEQLESSGG